MSTPVVMPLSRPIQAHGEIVTDLSFREPTGADLIRCGFPFRFETRGDASARVFDMIAIAELITDLAAIPRSSVALLCPIDFTRAIGVVTDFFAGAAETPPT